MVVGEEDGIKVAPILVGEGVGEMVGTVGATDGVLDGTVVGKAVGKCILFWELSLPFPACARKC